VRLRFQKAENLLITGPLDAQTADKLALRPEVREETRHGTTQDKPSAGIKWAKGSGQRSKTPRQPVKKSALPQSSRKDGEKSLQAENDTHQYVISLQPSKSIHAETDRSQATSHPHLSVRWSVCKTRPSKSHHDIVSSTPRDRREHNCSDL
jgi:hypothetical protein